MKKYSPYAAIFLLLLAACSLLGEATPSPVETATQSTGGGKCGDGVLDALEQVNPDLCPQDATAAAAGSTVPILPTFTVQPAVTPAASLPGNDIPPLYFFYAIHIHIVGADYAPYRDESLTQLDEAQAANMLAAIEGIAAVLDQHNVKGTWQVVYGTSQGLCAWQGQDHIFRQLVQSGHEIGIHVHDQEAIQTAYDNLRQGCGITPRTVSGFATTVDDVGSDLVQQVYSEDIRIAVDLGMDTAMGNISPLDTSSPFAEICGNRLGIGNDMWEQTGNLLFPWLPDYSDNNICGHDPDEDFTFIDHISANWMLAGQNQMPDMLGELNFTYLRQYLEGALAYMETNRPTRPAAWGFVTHIIEYAPGGQAQDPPDPASLAALDAFLDTVEDYASSGRIIFATASSIADAAYPGR